MFRSRLRGTFQTSSPDQGVPPVINASSAGATAHMSATLCRLGFSNSRMPGIKKKIGVWSAGTSLRRGVISSRCKPDNAFEELGSLFKYLLDAEKKIQNRMEKPKRSGGRNLRQSIIQALQDSVGREMRRHFFFRDTSLVRVAYIKGYLSFFLSPLIVRCEGACSDNRSGANLRRVRDDLNGLPSNCQVPHHFFCPDFSEPESVNCLFTSSRASRVWLAAILYKYPNWGYLPLGVWRLPASFVRTADSDGLHVGLEHIGKWIPSLRRSKASSTRAAGQHLCPQDPNAQRKRTLGSGRSVRPEGLRTGSQDLEGLQKVKQFSAENFEGLHEGLSKAFALRANTVGKYLPGDIVALNENTALDVTEIDIRVSCQMVKARSSKEEMFATRYLPRKANACLVQISKTEQTVFPLLLYSIRRAWKIGSCNYNWVSRPWMITAVMASAPNSADKPLRTIEPKMQNGIRLF
ncbi:hypothetical protein DFH09DRAFT_1424915 [Mycena vulgaris]|nr:hypothetical protein DFH09DRAFT_1424915 [Mycena vulgaris]